MARADSTPVQFLLKVLKPLADAGVLDSLTGRHGGFCLARPAKDITLLEVLEAVEGRLRAEAPQDSKEAAFDRKLQDVCQDVAEGGAVCAGGRHPGGPGGRDAEEEGNAPEGQRSLTPDRDLENPSGRYRNVPLTPSLPAGSGRGWVGEEESTPQRWAIPPGCLSGGVRRHGPIAAPACPGTPRLRLGAHSAGPRACPRRRGWFGNRAPARVQQGP
jgi:hypothetical protein